MAHRDIPVLETKRLILRGPAPEDYPDFKATFASYRSRFMGGPLSAYETWMLYAAEIGHWKIRGFGMWMIHDKATDEALGMAGGFTRIASRNSTRIIRVEDGVEKVIEVRVDEITDAGKKIQDVVIKPEDIIVVPESFF